MRPILRAWVSKKGLINVAAFFTALCTLGFSVAENSFAQEPMGVGDGETAIVVDSILPFDSFKDSLEFLPDTSVVSAEPVVDSSATPVVTPPVVPSVVQKPDPAPSKPLKNVLYLGGGERSPWFHLGVLYAIEEFGIPVDSIVATSWGAWVGALWSKGVSPDEIQRIMLDSDIAPYVGRNLIDERYEVSRDVPLSEEGIPSLRKRISLVKSATGHMDVNWRELSADSMNLVKNVARLRIQETLYRQPVARGIPFSLQACNENTAAELRAPTVDGIVESLPLWKDGAKEEIGKSSGELCPFLALPAEDRSDELSIIAVASPLRNSLQGDAKTQFLQKMAFVHLVNQPGLIVRAHAIADTSRKAWIQAGFSAMEQRRTSYGELSSRKMDYRSGRRTPAKPWFSFNPALDSLSPSIHDAIKSYWSVSDTGMTGPRNFTNRLQKNPAYDSLKFFMANNGDLLLESVVHPTIDLAAGGFGSNVIGANAYAEASLRYVDHVEMELKLAGFYGTSSFGFLPRVEVSKLWGLDWGFVLGYDYMKLQPLRSFQNEVDTELKFGYVERQDLSFNMYYNVDEHQRIAAEFLFGERVYTFDTTYFWNKEISTYPVSPALHYSFSNATEKGWFSTDGVELNVLLGMESIGYNAGIVDLVPIYWKLLLDAQYTGSPTSWLSLSIGAVGGMERYHEDGYGYVYPKSFENGPLDLVYRLHAPATPWSTEWFNPELSSHEYGMIRGSAGVHGKYLGAWLFGAYYHDFEDSPLASLEPDKLVFEPALRFAYKSVKIYMGMNKIVNAFRDLTDLSDYSYFIRVGEYSF